VIYERKSYWSHFTENKRIENQNINTSQVNKNEKKKWLMVIWAVNNELRNFSRLPIICE
jgi:hypothetical protein